MNDVKNRLESLSERGFKRLKWFLTAASAVTTSMFVVVLEAGV